MDEEEATERRRNYTRNRNTEEEHGTGTSLIKKKMQIKKGKYKLTNTTAVGIRACLEIFKAIPEDFSTSD